MLQLFKQLFLFKTPQHYADEASLKLSEEKYRVLFDANPQPMWLFDTETLQFLDVNEAAIKHYGYSREEFLSMTIKEIRPESEAERVFNTLYSPDGFIRHEESKFIHRKKDGTIIDVEIARFRLKDPISGRPARLVCVYDVTEKNKNKMALQILADAGTALFESVDIKDRLTAIANISVPNLADWCCVDLLNSEGQIERLLVHHRDSQKKEIAERLKMSRPDDSVNVRTVLATGKPVIVERVDQKGLRRQTDTFKNSPDSILEFSLALGLKSFMVLPLTAGGKVIGVLTYCMADSGRYFGPFEFEIGKELARRASISIDNALLYEDSKKANAAKSLFLANMSHEIRTPIGAMLGYSELALERAKDDPELNEYLSSIVRNGHHVIDLIGELLDLSKIEADKFDIAYSDCDLNEVFADILSALQIKANKKNIELNINFDGLSHPKLYTDCVRIKQILANIVGNAIKFTEKGSVAVLATQEVVSDGQVLTKIQVKDTGIGLTEEQAETLFRLFSQADPTLSRRFGGTGLGLVISRKIANLLGGNVELVSSTAGGGSTFLISFLSQISDLQTSSFSGKSSSGIKTKLHRAKILVVDDSPDNQVIVKTFLRNHGAEVHTASNGIEGYEKGVNEKFDLIFMDLQMPIADGYFAITQLRNSGLRIPIIALTAHALKEERERALSSGFTDYLTKPIFRDVLISTVSKYLNPKTQDETSTDL
jgi:PAS domain S-box-containing protein